jgi:gamma-glutamyltranspeptidase/glutathione hydrolase
LPSISFPRGRAPEVAERFASPDQARTLGKIAATRGEAFYRGELADAMVKHANAHGAAHALEDFAGHTYDWVKPLALAYAGAEVLELPPNGQGIAAQIALGILANFDLASLPPDSPQSQHLQIEAMKLGFADVHRHVSDPRTMRIAAETLLDRDYLAQRARLIDRRRAQEYGPGDPPQGGTVYLCAADESGMMVSLIQSNYMGFGPVSSYPTPASACRIAARAFRWARVTRTNSTAASAPSTRSFPDSSRATVRRSRRLA